MEDWDAEELNGLLNCPILLASSKTGVQTPGPSNFKICALTYYPMESVRDSYIHMPTHPLFPQVGWKSVPVEPLVFRVY